MKHFPFIFTILLLPIFTSCHKNNDESSLLNNAKNHSYEEVKDYFITFDEIFLKEEYSYYVYFFSYQCVHCNNIKNEVIEYALNENNERIYFIHFESDFPRCDDIHFSLVGINKIEDVCLVGTPSLLEIKDKQISEYRLGEEEVISLLLNKQ
ncbi:MAG: hypothetical protein ACI31G_04195 [Bacilli bacterium]